MAIHIRKNELRERISNTVDKDSVNGASNTATYVKIDGNRSYGRWTINEV